MYLFKVISFPDVGITIDRSYAWIAVRALLLNYSISLSDRELIKLNVIKYLNYITLMVYLRFMICQHNQIMAIIVDVSVEKSWWLQTKWLTNYSRYAHMIFCHQCISSSIRNSFVLTNYILSYFIFTKHANIYPPKPIKYFSTTPSPTHKHLLRHILKIIKQIKRT